MRMQAKHLRQTQQTQLKALSHTAPLAHKSQGSHKTIISHKTTPTTSTSTSANTVCHPHTLPAQQGPLAAMPQLASSVPRGGVDECQVMDAFGRLPITTSVTGVTLVASTPPVRHIESKCFLGEEERLPSTWAQEMRHTQERQEMRHTQELIHFIQSLELQFGPDTHRTHMSTGVPP